jgi:hypothetical protein
MGDDISAAQFGFAIPRPVTARRGVLEGELPPGGIAWSRYLLREFEAGASSFERAER